MIKDTVKQETFIILIFGILAIGMILGFVRGNNNTNDTLVSKYSDFLHGYNALQYEYDILDKKYVALQNDYATLRKRFDELQSERVVIPPSQSRYFVPYPVPKSSDECAMNKYVEQMQIDFNNRLRQQFPECYR